MAAAAPPARLQKRHARAAPCTHHTCSPAGVPYWPGAAPCIYRTVGSARASARRTARSGVTGRTAAHREVHRPGPVAHPQLSRCRATSICHFTCVRRSVAHRKVHRPGPVAHPQLSRCRATSI